MTLKTHIATTSSCDSKIKKQRKKWFTRERIFPPILKFDEITKIPYFLTPFPGS